jgi:uncharacterized repeat protein (TIGR03803 family)
MRSKYVSTGLTATAILALTLFGITPRALAQTTAVLHSFSNNGKDGYNPWANLVFDSSGNLYGTTAFGGASSCGTAFELSPLAGGGWTEKILRAFNNTDGCSPYGGLVLDAAGNLYGTTRDGGNYGNGTAYELTPSAGGWTEKVLHSFQANGTDGYGPTDTLILDPSGSLYGTTAAGGTHAGGTIFKLTPTISGGWSEKVLYNLAPGTGNYPTAGVVFDSFGNLFGTTQVGGTYNYGTVFELKPTPGGWAEKTLHHFNQDGVDGFFPTAGVILDASGNLYGTTPSGGRSDQGIVFELSPTPGGTWIEKFLHSFTDTTSDGGAPFGGLVLDASGNLYGTTNGGGLSNDGIVFELTPVSGGGWNETVLLNFNGSGDGQQPYAGLIFDASGSLFGTAVSGGPHGAGTVFEIKP